MKKNNSSIYVPWIEEELGTRCEVEIAGVPWIERESPLRARAGAGEG